MTASLAAPLLALFFVAGCLLGWLVGRRDGWSAAISAHAGERVAEAADAFAVVASGLSADALRIRAHTLRDAAAAIVAGLEPWADGYEEAARAAGWLERRAAEMESDHG